HTTEEESIGLLEILDRVPVQVFVRNDCTMITTAVQGDVDGIPKGSHRCVYNAPNVPVRGDGASSIRYSPRGMARHFAAARAGSRGNPGSLWNPGHDASLKSLGKTSLAKSTSAVRRHSMFCFCAKSIELRCGG